MEGKTAVQILEVFDDNEVKRDQIVMCPNNCLATRRPNTTDEKVPNSTKWYFPIGKKGWCDELWSADTTNGILTARIK